MGERESPQPGAESADEADVHVTEPVQLQGQEAGADLGEDRGQALIEVDCEQVSVGDLQVLQPGAGHQVIQAAVGEPALTNYQIHYQRLSANESAPCPGHRDPGQPGHQTHSRPQLLVHVLSLAL